MISMIAERLTFTFPTPRGPSEHAHSHDGTPDRIFLTVAWGYLAGADRSTAIAFCCLLGVA